jgi:hypothetical protein
MFHPSCPSDKSQAANGGKNEYYHKLKYCPYIPKRSKEKRDVSETAQCGSWSTSQEKRRE